MTTSRLLGSGEFARESGLSRKALRLYDESGLLSPTRVDGDTGYRYYSSAQVNRAKHISLLRRLGMPLVRVATILDQSGAGSAAGAANRLTAWWNDEERAFAERKATVEYLLRAWGDLAPVDYHVRSRRVADRKVATVTSEVTQPDLVETMIELVTRVRNYVDASEADRGDEFWVLYHGVVSPDSAGPIEVCVPITGRLEPRGAIGVRIEQAHHEAHVAITGAECRYPVILHAYDAVDRWVNRHGRCAGPSREIYPIPWDEVAGGGPVAEIVRPYQPSVGYERR